MLFKQNPVGSTRQVTNYLFTCPYIFFYMNIFHSVSIFKTHKDAFGRSSNICSTFKKKDSLCSRKWDRWIPIAIISALSIINFRIIWREHMQSVFEFPHFSHVFRKLSRKQSQVARPKRIYLTTGGKVLKLMEEKKIIMISISSINMSDIFSSCLYSNLIV